MKKFSFLAVLFLIVAFTSCKVTLVPARSPEAITQVQQAAAATDSLYDAIISSHDKSYASYALGYDAINEQITQILILDSSRNNAKRVLTIAHDINNRFLKYQSDHQRAGKLNNSQALSKKDYMHSLFSSLQNAENNFK